ncbi:hypothetical protein [Herbiconiux solani]|uniref:hypothetical protein n=1 Tax=Herbiconiux solani TaxID=661329 RepID=UPI000825CBE1|nr:hypothetical protein [Herbiconiux solani]
MSAAPTLAPDPQASGLTVEYNVVELVEDRDGLQTSTVHETFDSEVAAEAEADRMNHEFGERSLFGAGDSREYVVDEVWS